MRRKTTQKSRSASNLENTESDNNITNTNDQEMDNTIRQVKLHKNYSEETDISDTTENLNTNRPPLQNVTDNSASEYETNDTPVSKRKAGVPRKSLMQYTNDLSDSETGEVREMQLETCMKRKSSRPRKIPRYMKTEEESTTGMFENIFVKSEPASANLSVENVVEEVEEVEKVPKKRRSRKRGGGRPKQNIYSGNDSSDNEETSHLIVTCAICTEEMEKKCWKKHKLQHNNLCWRLGYPELDLSNEKLVISILHKLAAIQKHSLTCEQCGALKKSVAGFMSHKSQCNKTKEEILAMRVACPVCNRLMQPSSLKVHISVHSQKKQPKDTTTLSGEPDEDGKVRRKAAKRAVGLMQQVTEDDSEKKMSALSKAYKRASETNKSTVSGGLLRSFQKILEDKGSINCPIRDCGYKATDERNIKSHVKICPKLYPDDIICRYCLYLTETEEDMLEHIKSKHLKSEDENYLDGPVDDSDEEEENTFDESMKKKNLFSQRKNYYKFDFLMKEKRVLPSIICTYPAAFNWNLDFWRKNASVNLFPEYRCLKSDWIPILRNDKNVYLPTIKKSMFVKQVCVEDEVPNLQGTEHLWERYKLFDSVVSEDSATMFCGGPIWALAWAPTPLDSIADQYLAVSVHRDPDVMYKISKSYSSNEMIQFWNCGELTNKRRLFHPPHLEFCLAHSHGMVWNMEWCPSGCYDEFYPDEKSLKRLGMLALACSDANIVIYTLCFTDNLGDHPVPKVYKTKETFRLILEHTLDQNLGLWSYQATKVTWSKTLGHSLVVGGYSNGLVALFDLNNKSAMLRSEENGTVILKPYHVFQAHVAVITVLSLHTLDNGKRWLLTGSWDRSNKYWDLEDTSAYTAIHTKRGLITDGILMSNWLSSYLSYDDVFSLAHCVTTVQNVRDFCYKQSSALATNSMVTSISGSDWANALAQVSLAGELSASFPQQMFVSYDVDKSLKCKRLILGYSELVEMSLAPKEREEKMKKKEKQVNIDFSDKDDKYILKYLMNKNTEEFDEEPDTYEEAQKKYGLIFCDFKLEIFGQIPKEALIWTRQSNRMKVAPLELYPLVSINRVQWNPNKQAFLYLATGYHAGFVRIKCVRFMNTKLVGV